MRTLSDEEIKEVGNIMYERHPMYYDNSKIHDIFPSLKVSFSLKKHEFIPIAF